ncbi:hypothetical protein [Pelosinus sp. UFO1]|uniref:hypothetical protein n=1 Tax=Pelosinus sp. UFO1 TaxID=484770 RepID=UPI0004D0B316|nr:hypothetical protein [Pelosinus sp. UFO1]AIF54152.1 hypothetical protein UFO1_4617 [Pelosinus sp. UFO1]
MQKSICQTNMISFLMLEAHYDVIIIPLLFPEKFTVGVDAVFAGVKTANSLAYAAEAPLRSSW